MNIKKILVSLVVIGTVGFAGIQGVRSFFSDTETSTGNLFKAGAIDLLIDNESYVTNGLGALIASPNTSWQAGDLDGHLFFNFDDLKPGDIGEDTISLHVNNNDAWLCAAARVTDDSDVDYSEPELEDDATVNESDPEGTDGELAENMQFAFWADDGDNVLETDEVGSIFVSGPLSELGVGGQIALADSQNNVWTNAVNSPVTGAKDYYIGKAWCFGSLEENAVNQDQAGKTGSNGPLVRGTGFNCNGASDANNAAQTDRVMGDIQFYAVQSRNNANFLCSEGYRPDWPTPSPSSIPGPVVAASYETGFEPGESFSVGNIDGQNGWKNTKPFDSEVVSSPVIADDQSLRISNSVTSGSFGDQTFAPELASGAGETGIGTENHFEAEFDIKTTEPGEQSGLALSVSPDDGLGSRMSYLGFADEAGGFRVTFYDVTDPGGIGTVATFNPTDLGLLDRSTAHTIKFVMDFVDGPANDIVKIYIDGSLVHTGTSWEDYYRYDPEQSGNSNQLFAVDTLIFRAAGTAVPANAGKGFLIDKVSLLSGSI